MFTSYYFCLLRTYSLFFSYNVTATTKIYTLSLHDALPILAGVSVIAPSGEALLPWGADFGPRTLSGEDRKSTRLNSSHRCISYAVFCLKKKTNALMNRQINDLNISFTNI